MINEDETVCQWFALCPNPATVTVPHPVLGDVPACIRCAELSGQTYRKP